VTDYRSPEEDALQSEQRARIEASLDRAVQHGASCIIAIELGEDPAVVETWIDNVWNTLRGELLDDQPDVHHADLSIRVDDRLAAIIMLLEPRMNEQARQLLADIEAVGE
jgi:hypothetical protein